MSLPCSSSGGARPAAAMTVLLHRVDFLDACGKQNQQQQHCTLAPQHDGNDTDTGLVLQMQSSPIENLTTISHHQQVAVPIAPVAPYAFVVESNTENTRLDVAICRVPSQVHCATPVNSPWLLPMDVDRTVPCPYDATLSKYWKQRHRLFRNFDGGIQLDEEGLFSVTPEQIANHVANRTHELLLQATRTMDSNKQPMIILDAFCGCGGNSIAFAKLPNVVVVAADIDVSKLQMAAHNAAIYKIAPHKLVFVNCNALFLLEHCYRNGDFVLDQHACNLEGLQSAVETNVVCGGYQIGGIDLLPQTIHAVFMDPPWGGVDYEVLGKNGYVLQRHMRIQRHVVVAEVEPPEPGKLENDFFDTFESSSYAPKQRACTKSRNDRKAQFNQPMDDSDCVNGAELIALAAKATATHLVIYDTPRNIHRGSLGQAALAAGHRGNCKLDEHFLNGRLKTVTAYLGSDWSFLMNNDAASAGQVDCNDELE
jgi:trimethylguanosine synthase